MRGRDSGRRAVRAPFVDRAAEALERRRERGAKRGRLLVLRRMRRLLEPDEVAAWRPPVVPVFVDATVALHASGPKPASNVYMGR